MYDYDNDEDTAGYDCKYDGGESEARHGINMRELYPKPKSEPRDLADGLREYIESKAGRPFPDHYDENDDDVDVKKLYKELWARADKELDKELEDPAYWEEVFKDANERSVQTPMYDFGLGKMSNERAMLDFYGLDIVQTIRREISEANNLPDHVREIGQVSTKLWQELRDIRAGRIPNPKSASKKKSAGKHNADPQNNDDKKSEPSATKSQKKKSEPVEIVQRERERGDDYYMRTERGVIRNRSYRELFQGRGIVYEWIWANLVRSEWIDTKGYPVKEKYYDRGLLAYCSTPQIIGDECGLAKNTVIKYLDKFKEAGIIKVDYLVPKDGKRGQSVYILGTWKMEKVMEDGKLKDKIVERFYRDEVFLSKKPVKN